MALGSVAASAYFAVAGYGYLQARSVEALRSPGTEARPASVGGDASEASVVDIARTILERNIFDSATGGIAWQDAIPDVEVASDGEISEEEDVEPAPIAPCTGDVQLLAALIFDREPHRSSAVLRRGSVSKVVPLQADFDGAQLLALYPTHAYVKEASGATCQLPLYKPSAQQPAAPPPPPPAAAKKERKKTTKPGLFTPEELETGIVSLGGDRYKVSRELLTRAMADAAGVVRGTKFLPQTGGQRNAGVKVQGVREGTTLHKLGMRDGDVLRALNGVDLSSPDGMLGAYGLLREQGTLTLAITRGGSARNLQYTLE